MPDEYIEELTEDFDLYQLQCETGVPVNDQVVPFGWSHSA